MNIALVGQTALRMADRFLLPQMSPYLSATGAPCGPSPVVGWAHPPRYDGWACTDVRAMHASADRQRRSGETKSCLPIFLRLSQQHTVHPRCSPAISGNVPPQTTGTEETRAGAPRASGDQRREETQRQSFFGCDMSPQRLIQRHPSAAVACSVCRVITLTRIKTPPSCRQCADLSRLASVAPSSAAARSL